MPTTGNEPNPPIPYDWPAWHVDTPPPLKPGETRRDWPLAFYILSEPRRIAEAAGDPEKGIAPDPIRLCAEVMLPNGQTVLLAWRHDQVRKIRFPWFFLGLRYPMKRQAPLSLPRVKAVDLPTHVPPPAVSTVLEKDQSPNAEVTP
jgi:hypothetical protein